MESTRISLNLHQALTAKAANVLKTQNPEDTLRNPEKKKNQKQNPEDTLRNSISLGPKPRWIPSLVNSPGRPSPPSGSEPGEAMLPRRPKLGRGSKIGLGPNMEPHGCCCFLIVLFLRVKTRTCGFLALTS